MSRSRSLSDAARAFGLDSGADPSPRLGRLSTTEDDCRGWAIETRGRFGVPVRVFKRNLSAGGVSTFVWVAIVWPKGSGK